MGTNLQGYHLLWPDLPTFSQLQFTAPFRPLNLRPIKRLFGFFGVYGGVVVIDYFLLFLGFFV